MISVYQEENNSVVRRSCFEKMPSLIDIKLEVLAHHILYLFLCEITMVFSGGEARF